MLQAYTQPYRIGWAGIAMLFFALSFLPTQGGAYTFTFPPELVSCLASLGAYKLFPDGASAYAAVSADCDVPYGYYYQWGCTPPCPVGFAPRCPDGTPLPPNCGFSAHACANAQPDSYGYNTHYWYPIYGCPNSVTPVQIPDPPVMIQQDDQNLGVPGASSALSSTCPNVTNASVGP